MLNKVFPDKEKAKSLLKMAVVRKKSVDSLDMKYVTIISENYYEIIKELSTALFLLNGIKYVGVNAHKEMIDGLKRFSVFGEDEILVLQDLRIRRNNSQYEGEPFSESYIENKRKVLNLIIDKLKKLVEDRLI